MKIISFGITKDITGALLLDVNLVKSPLSVAELKEELFKLYPELGNLSTLSIAVNNQYATDETIVNAADEVALIPPVSGG